MFHVLISIGNLDPTMLPEKRTTIKENDPIRKQTKHLPASPESWPGHFPPDFSVNRAAERPQQGSSKRRVKGPRTPPKRRRPRRSGRRVETAGLKEFGEFRTRLASAAFGSFGEKKSESATALGACRRAVDAVWEAFR
eukprot:2534104-Pyramimonas_sp.AAC.1